MRSILWQSQCQLCVDSHLTTRAWNFDCEHRYWSGWQPREPFTLGSEEHKVALAGVA